MSDLKNCPNCDGEVELSKSVYFVGVRCKKCNYNMPADKVVEGRAILDVDHAIAQHNTRANPWIKFDAKNPPKPGKYICKVKWLKSGVTRDEYMTAVDEPDVLWRVEGFEFNEFAYDVTHYMPIPELEQC